MKHKLIKVLFGLLICTLFILGQAMPGTMATAVQNETNNDAYAINIAVTSVGSDNIGAILTNMGYPWTEISDTDLTDYEKIKDFDVIFANCSGGAYYYAEDAAEPLQEFVQNGGSLYASDFAFLYIAEAFPGHVDFYEPPRIGLEGDVEAEVIDAGLANYLDPADPPATIDIFFNLASWVPVEGVAPTTTVYLTGDIEVYDFDAFDMDDFTRLVEDSPLTVSFKPYEDSAGTVIYTAFHNHAQIDDIGEKLLEYLVLIPQTSDLVDELLQFLKDAGYPLTQTNINTINPGQTSPMFSYILNQVGDLIFGINWAGSELTLRVYKPDETLFAEVTGDSPPYMIEIKDAEPGIWRYTVTGVDVPSDNYPFVVAIGDTTIVLPGPGFSIFLPLIIH